MNIPVVLGAIIALAMLAAVGVMLADALGIGRGGAERDERDAPAERRHN